MRGITRIKRIIRNTRRLAHPVSAILIYHRVIALPSDKYNLAVSPDHFAQHLEVIRRKYSPFRLSELPDAMKTGSLPHRSVVITFDDGYADNFQQALPLLEAYQMPATIFVVSGSVNSPREFWWDDVERILLSSQNLPPQLALCIGDETLQMPTSSIDQRMDAMATIHPRLRGLSYQERDRILFDLVQWSGAGANGRLENLPVQLDVLCQASKSPFIEIGAHTKTHPVLSALPPDKQRAEILESRLALENMLGKRVLTFAYPYGNDVDFTQQTVEIARSSGFKAAVTTIQGAVDPGDDLYQLKRCEVNDWDVNQFTEKLDSFFYA